VRGNTGWRSQHSQHDTIQFTTNKIKKNWQTSNSKKSLSNTAA